MDEQNQDVLEVVAEATPPKPATVTVVDIHFRNGSKIYFFDPRSLTIATGDHVIIDTARGAEYGICAAGNHQIGAKDIVAPLRPVLRIADHHDRRIAQENQEKEKKAMEICQQKISAQKLDMQLVSAEYAFDGSKILFFFTADGRVDFRELVKNLASVFRTRIELRQIGVRDKAKMVGGLGVCGRPFCCSQFLDDFQPVSIKMAKTQNLSLNPTKISGTCGRLMCCLKYEQAAYEDLLKTAPKNDSFVDTPEGRGTICDVNLLRQSVRVRMEDHPEIINSFKNDEIAILRSGKARKTDAPIPRDVAPISSKPRAPKPALATGNEGFVEPIIIGEAVAPKPDTRRPPRNRKPKPEQGGQNQPKGEQKPRPPKGEQKPKPPKQNQPQNKPAQPKPQKPAGEQPATEGGEAKPKSNNRRRYRPRRPKNPNGGQGGGQPKGE